ncbi:alpha/beta hydrolase family protein [Streptomyces sp. NPDC059788]|uniref:alpha/beta hydrolase family protein n=1 Tax=Streptomyces sp. NPDC059788 TaxID=3346948 RepID=UPI003663E1AB
MIRIRRGALAALLALALPLPLASAGSASVAGSDAPATTTKAARAAKSAWAAKTANATPTAPAASATPTALQGAPSPQPSLPPATATAPSPLALPRPTGPYAVGRDSLHLVDPRRKDPWEPSSHGRELMVSLYYPARTGTGRPAPYMTTAEAATFLDRQRQTGQLPPEAGQLPPEVFSGTRTNTHTGALPAHGGALPVRGKAGGKHPLVVLSPGFGLNRATLSVLAEDLTSRGYVVALVDHAYEADASFPGGRVLRCVACEKLDPKASPDAVEAFMATVARNRAKDVGFLLDRILPGHHPAWKYSSLIDPKRVGMAGHSIGGATAGTAMAGDSRIRAGVNLDGSMSDPLPEQGLNGRPFLLFGGQETGHSGTDKTWDTSWPRLNGWKRWLTVTGATHLTFTDIPALAQQAGLPTPQGTVPGPRGSDLTRTYVSAFFDRHLRGIPHPLLDGPAPATPEILFHHP